MCLQAHVRHTQLGVKTTNVGVLETSSWNRSTAPGAACKNNSLMSHTKTSQSQISKCTIWRSRKAKRCRRPRQKVKRRDEMAEGNSSNCFLSQSAAASRWPRRCQTSSTSQTHTNYTRELVCIFIGGANSGSWDYNDRWHRGGGVAAEEAWRREKDWGKIKRNKCYMWEITCWELTTMFQFGRAWASLYSANSYLCVPPSADMCTSPSPHRLPLPSRRPCLFSVIPLPPSILLSRKGNPSCS